MVSRIHWGGCDMEIRFTDGSYTDGGERIMLDPTVYPDWQIGAAAERALPPVEMPRGALRR